MSPRTERGITNRTGGSPTPDRDLSRQAKLIADGELPFPEALPKAAAFQLAREVQNRRRVRLIQFLARQVAQYLCDRQPDEVGGTPHVDESI